MIVVKDGVVFKKFTAGIIWAIARLDLLSKISELCPAEIMITSANDSTHSAGSKHYYDEAFDVRSHNFDVAKKELFRTQLEDFLNSNSPCYFTVLLEYIGTPNEHFHIQVRRGTRYQ